MNYIKLGEICNIKSSKRIYQSEYCEKGIPFYRGKEISQLQRGEDIEVELFISKERFKEIREKYGVINKGDLLITSVGTIGNTWVSDGREFYYKDGNITQIEKNDSINTKFISYLFKSDIVKKQYLKGTSGTAQIALTIEKLNKLQIPKIDLRIQNKIVEVLDKAQELIDKRKAQIEALDELVKSQFIEMFGDLKVNSKQLNVLSFEEFATIDTNMTKDFEKYADYPHIGIDSIEKNTGNILEYKFVKECSLKSGKYLFDERHIIYSKIRPNLNKVALPKFKGVCSADAYPILCIDKIVDRNYLGYVLRSEFFLNYILAFSGRTNIPKVNKEQLKGFNMPTPPIELQNQFADFVKQVDKLKFEMQDSLKELEYNFNSLMQKAFNGELFK
ncbi:restriction endonuclease subunit S [Clostridium botulinum]|nr:restriction endonuclease subunit S [Clostridium botulinum]